MSEPIGWVYQSDLQIFQEGRADFIRMYPHPLGGRVPVYGESGQPVAVPDKNSFLKERAQLEQEWSNLRALKSQYERALGQKTIVPDGYKIVPINPTKEMLEAAEQCYFHTYTGTATMVPDRCYAAMIEAAPKPEEIK